MAAPTDRVQVLKQESAAGGGNPADDDPFLNSPIDETEDALSAAGLFIQEQGGPADEDAGIWREGGILKAKDTGHATINLLDSAAGTNVGGDVDFLLESAPPEPDTNYVVTRTSGQVSKEEWTRNPGNLLKSIDYTRSGGQVETVVTKVFDADGTTVLAQTTETFTRTGGLVTSSAKTRDV